METLECVRRDRDIKKAEIKNNLSKYLAQVEELRE